MSTSCQSNREYSAQVYTITNELLPKTLFHVVSGFKMSNLQYQLTNLREVSKLSTAGNNFFGLLQYPSVDDHDVGELCGKPKLNLHSTVKLQAKALW